MPTPVDFNLYLITDRHQVPDGDLPRAVGLALEGGVRAVQLREKDLAEPELLALARELRTLTKAFGARLFINSRIETVLAIGADGVHLPSAAPDIAGARCRLGPDALIGVSAHLFAEVRQAERAGADFVTFGPVCPTPSKLVYGDPVGFEPLARACRDATIPVFALGGLKTAHIPILHRSGCSRAALISAILAAQDPCRAGREFISLLNQIP